jgi:phage terminase large subunit-like protein
MRHHVGVFAELETQMCSFVPDHLDGSPDRVDALVWALTELMLGSPGENLFEYYGGLLAEKAAGDKGSL